MNIDIDEAVVEQFRLGVQVNIQEVREAVKDALEKNVFMWFPKDKP